MARRYRKRLTIESHYQASAILHDLLNGRIPEHVDWEVKDEHLTILKLFVIKGMTPVEIARSQVIISKRGTPMDRDMISIWLRKYLPTLEYEEKTSTAKRNYDKEESRNFQRLKRRIPKTGCAYCGSTNNLELDHIKPYYEGGKSELSNLQWLCRDCHVKKTLQERERLGWDRLHSKQSNKGEGIA